MRLTVCKTGYDVVRSTHRQYHQNKVHNLFRKEHSHKNKDSVQVFLEKSIIYIYIFHARKLSTLVQNIELDSFVVRRSFF